jgi:hypothetical protein
MDARILAEFLDQFLRSGFTILPCVRYKDVFFSSHAEFSFLFLKLN